MTCEEGLVSVVTPVYNASAWLARCLESIVRQTHARLEIILINDGSTDDSPRICRDYAARDGRIVFVDQENRGPSEARNAGLDCATGEFVMFVDADDFILPEMAEALLRGMSAHDGIGWSLCGCVQVRGFGDQAEKTVIPLGYDGKRPAIDVLMGFARGDVKIMTTFASLWNKLYRADVIDGNGIRFGTVCPGTDIPVYPQEDFFFNLRYRERIDSVCFVDKPLYGYQTHQGNENAVRKYRPHAFELHQEVYGAIRRTILPVCTPDEKRNFNRHYLDKTLIIMGILCRDNKTFGRTELVDKLRRIVGHADVRASLADFAPAGSQDSALFELMRREEAEALYEWANRKGNEMYGRC